MDGLLGPQLPAARRKEPSVLHPQPVNPTFLCTLKSAESQVGERGEGTAGRSGANETVLTLNPALWPTGLGQVISPLQARDSSLVEWRLTTCFRGL